MPQYLKNSLFKILWAILSLLIIILNIKKILDAFIKNHVKRITPYKFFLWDDGFIYFTGYINNQKVFIKFDLLIKNLKNEFNALKKVQKINNKPFLLPNIKLFNDNYIIYEFIDAKEVSDDNSKINNIIKRIKKFLAKHKIIHNDLINRNFLITSNNKIYLLDWYFCKHNNNKTSNLLFNIYQSRLIKKNKTKDKISILFLHQDNKASGSFLSLSEIIKRLHKDKRFELFLINIFIKPINNKIIIGKILLPKINLTIHSQYAGIRKLLLIYEITILPFFLFYLLYIKFILKKEFDIIHANETVLILSGVLAKFIFKSKLIIHVRSKLNNTLLNNRLNKYLFRKVDQFICIDNIIANSVPDYYKNKINIIYNIQSFKYLENSSESIVNNDYLKIGYAGALTNDKGIINSIIAVTQAIKENKLKIKFYIAGYDIRQTNNIFLKKLYKIFGISFNNSIYIKKYISEQNLKNNFIFLKYIKNMSIFYKLIDLNIFTSNLDSYNRTVFEAAFFKIPSLVSLKKINASNLIDNKNVFLIESSNIQNIKNKIFELYNNRQLIKKTGLIAKNFFGKKHNPENNYLCMRKIYIQLSE